MALAKAKLLVDYLYVASLIPVPDEWLSLECQFNPAELGITKSISWSGDESTVPSRDMPRTEYKGGLGATYTLALTFDAYASGGPRRDVRKDINKLMAMGLRTSGYSVPVAFPYLGEPPSVILVWGALKLFRAVLVQIDAKYTMFDENGCPTRATAACTFKEQSHPLDFLPPQNPTSRTEPRHTVRVVEGDRIDLIANRYFGDSRMWRGIAERNDLDDPFHLKPGSLLAMPNLD